MTKMEVNRTIFESAAVNKTNPRSVVYDVCVNMPPKIVSDGIWADPDIGSFPSHSSLTMFELQIITIFTLIHCFHFVLKRLGFPYFVSQLVVCSISPLYPSLCF